MGDKFPKPGGVFEERYRIESVVGHGGFARIYLAEQIDLGRKVAIKVLNPGLRNDPGHGNSISERFRREAKLVASLRDSHTVIMHDYGRTEDGLLYMVFEYIDGVTLSELVRREGRVSPERVAKILRQCLSSLQEAHALGILHRDIKPANIMVYEHVGRTDQVKVLDFGIAKSVLSEDEGSMSGDLTKAGMIVGTPRYMAPEQLRGTPLGPFTDLYSLGLIAYELLAGQKAIRADSMVSIITHQVSEEPIRLPEDLELSPRFKAIIEGLLQKSEQMRFQNTAEVLVALDALDKSDLQASPGWNSATRPMDSQRLAAGQLFTEHTPSGAVPAVPPPTPGSVAAASHPAEPIEEAPSHWLNDAPDYSPSETIMSPKKQARSLYLGGALAILLLGLIAAFVFWPETTTNPDATEPNLAAGAPVEPAQQARADSPGSLKGARPKDIAAAPEGSAIDKAPMLAGTAADEEIGETDTLNVTDTTAPERKVPTNQVDPPEVAKPEAASRARKSQTDRPADRSDRPTKASPAREQKRTKQPERDAREERKKKEPEADPAPKRHSNPNPAPASSFPALDGI